VSRRRRLAVALTAGDLAAARVETCTVAVIDVLRATSTLVQAFAAGAAEAVPAATPEAARRLRDADPGALLCGERGRVRIPGFHLGNSPLEFTPERVAGRRLIVATTNGSRTLLGAAPAPLAVLAAFGNAGAVTAALLAADRDVLLACSGDSGRPCPEDTVLAGCLLARLRDAEPDAELDAPAGIALDLWERSGGRVAPFLAGTEAGAELLRLGLERDLEFCAAVDRLAVVPRLRPGTPGVVGPGRA